MSRSRRGDHDHAGARRSLEDHVHSSGVKSAFAVKVLPCRGILRESKGTRSTSGRRRPGATALSGSERSFGLLHGRDAGAGAPVELRDEPTALRTSRGHADVVDQRV